MTGIDYSRLRYQVVRIARANTGFGDGGTNGGPFIKAMGGRQGAEWCALFAGYCYRRAYEELGLRIPDWLYRRKGVPETGAKTLTKALGRVGSIFKPDADVALPGDLVCWSRGFLGWQGHVGIVTENGRYISGNEGRLGLVLDRPIAGCKLKLWRFASIVPRED